MSNSIHSLDHLETDVLARMARHRESQNDAGTLPAGVTLAVISMAIGIVIGWSQGADLTASRGSETIVLADDARFSPAELLASR